MRRVFGNPGDMRVAVVGDSPLVTSGFGNVVRMAVEGFLRRGFNVYVLGALDVKYDPELVRRLPYVYWPVTPNDAMGDQALNEFLAYVKPSVVFMVWDGGTLERKVSMVRAHRETANVPVVVYFPVEGLPIFPAILRMCKAATHRVTYCRFGQRELGRLGVERVYQAYHGYDHMPVERYTPEERARLKELFGFSGRFLVGCVGVNKRTNNQPKVIEAARYVSDDVLVYLHCKAFDGHIMGGWDLSWMPEYYGVSDRVLIKPDPPSRYKYYYEPYVDQVLSKEALLNMGIPGDEETRLALWNRAPYVVKLNTFDVLLDAASVHGFNLPALESIMCGVPIISVWDDAARSEIYGDVCYMMRPDQDSYSVWHLGVKLVEVSPRQIAQAIMDWHDNYDSLYQKHQIPAYEKFKGWTWSRAQQLFCDLVEYGVDMCKS